MTVDTRKKYALQKGDIICCGKLTYMISGDPIGYGGSALIYPAKCSDSELDYAIKEYYPINDGEYARKNGIIQPIDDDDKKSYEKLNYIRKNQRKERELGQLISNTSRRTICIEQTLIPDYIIIDKKKYDEVQNGIYAILERIDTKGISFADLLKYISDDDNSLSPLYTGGLPDIRTTIKIIEEVLLALQRVHDAEYLFGDIQAGNIFFSDCRLEKGDIGIGTLMDFGCVRSLEKNGYTAPITDCQIFSTPGYVPPEILYGNDGTLCLGKQADIYSVGCLFLRCILTETKIRMIERNKEHIYNVLDPIDAKRINAAPKVAKLINEILAKMLEVNPSDRYENIDEILNDLHKIKQIVKRPRYLLPSNLSSPEYFVDGSRDWEIKYISQSINEKQPVFLWGFGGIGKTELAIKFARELPKNQNAYLVHFKESIRKTVIGLPFSGYELPNMEKLSKEQRVIVEEKIYREKLDILKEYPEEDVLIIDNFDSDILDINQMMQEAEYQELIGIRMHIIFTTRGKPDDNTPEIKALDKIYLYKLMKKYIVGQYVSDEMIYKLIEAVNSHTLTIELIAKAIGNRIRPLSAEKILSCLYENNLKNGVVQKTKTSKDRKYEEKTIYEHLKTLFNLSSLSVDEQLIMRHSTLFPITGIALPLLRRAENKENIDDVVNSLVLKGWMQLSDTSVVSIHPLIQTLAIEELKPNYDNTYLFLYWLHDNAMNDQRYRISTASCRKYSKDEEDSFDRRKRLTDLYGYKEFSSVEAEITDSKEQFRTIGEVYSKATKIIEKEKTYYGALAAESFSCSGDQDKVVMWSHWVLDELIKKYCDISENTRVVNLFDMYEQMSYYVLLEIWCPQLVEGSWDIDYSWMYGNELQEEHLDKKPEVQSIYYKLKLINGLKPVDRKKRFVEFDATGTVLKKFNYFEDERYIIPNGVIRIEDEAFAKCINLKTVVMPESVKNLGKDVFLECKNLEEVILSSCLEELPYGTFCGCESMRKISIPNKVKTIGEDAFLSCKKLESISMPDSVCEIGKCAFRNCHSLTSIKIPENVTILGEEAFMDCELLESVILPKKVTQLPVKLFSGCNKINIIELPDDLTTIGDFCFFGCNNLKEIIIPHNLKNVSAKAFINSGIEHFYIDAGNPYMITENGSLFTKDKKKLICCPPYNSQFTLFNETEEVGEAACQGNCRIKIIKLSKNVIELGAYAFSGCKELEEICIEGDKLKKVGDYCFYRCSKLKSVQFPSSVVHMGMFVFSECYRLEKINLPDHLTEMGEGAFKKCYSLNNIVIPANIKIVPKEICAECYKLERAILAKGTTGIKNNAFADCISLKEIVNTESVELVENAIFQFCIKLKEPLLADNCMYVGDMDMLFLYTKKENTTLLMYQYDKTKIGEWNKMHIDQIIDFAKSIEEHIKQGNI